MYNFSFPKTFAPSVIGLKRERKQLRGREKENMIYEQI